MSPQEAIASLDRAVAEDGEDVVLRRIVGTVNSVNLDVTCRAFVRPYRLREELLVGTMAQFDFVVTMSKTQIDAAQWPGGMPVSPSGIPIPDPSIPRKGDRILIKGTFRNIEVVGPIEMGGQIVRIEMMTLG